MSALEQEIYEKFQQLDDAAQARVLQALAQSQASAVDEGDWLDEARTLRAEMRAKYGKLAFSVAMLVNEVREEEGQISSMGGVELDRRDDEREDEQ